MKSENGAASGSSVEPSRIFEFDASKSKRGIRQIEEEIVQDALDETGFGKFNLKILAVSILIVMNSGLGMMNISFVLTAAACDFEMATVDQSRLTVSSTLGMLLGSFLWGCIADIKGRKISLVASTVLHGVSELLSSVTPVYWGFLLLKFSSGLSICGQLTLVFSYLGEFQPRKKRDSLLAWIETAWVAGMVASACIAWATISSTIEYRSGIFFFHSWNLFVMVCSLPALGIGSWLSFLPETPKYLAEIGRNAEMLTVLARMYSENSGNPRKDYLTNLKNSENQSLSELASEAETKGEAKAKSLKETAWHTFSQTLLLLQKPYLGPTLVVCLMAYLIMSSYYMLFLWLPDLFQRYAAFQERFPGSSAGVCTVVRMARNNETATNATDPHECDASIESRVYLYALVMTLSGVPVGLSLPFLLDRVGYKLFLGVSIVLSGIAALCIYLVRTSVENLIVSSIFQPLTSIGGCIISCMAVNLYPTRLRSIAAGLVAFCSRLGALAGNLVTGSLIDEHCAILIGLVAAQLFACGALCLFLPREKGLDDKADDKVDDKADDRAPKMEASDAP